MKQACLLAAILAFSVTHIFGQALRSTPSWPTAWPAEQIEHINLAAWVVFFEDTTSRLLPAAVLKQHFKPMPCKNWLKKRGEYVRSRIWLRFSIDNTAGTDTLRLVFFPGMHARTALYELKNDSLHLEAVGGVFVVQTRFAWQANPNGLPVVVLPGEHPTYLVSVSNFAKLYDQIRSELFAPAAYRSYCQAYKEMQLPFLLFLGFTIGGLTMLALFGLMQFLLTRGPAYFWYAMFALGNALNFARLVEMYIDVRWISSLIPAFHGYTSLPATAFFYLLFVRYFLDLHLQNNLKSRLLAWAAWFFGAVFFATLITNAIHFSGQGISNETAEIFAFFHVLYLFPAILMLYIAFTIKDGLARFVATGTLLLFAASIFVLLVPLFTEAVPMREQHPAENPTWVLCLFVLLESLCFALGLGYKTKLLEMQKRLAVEGQERDRRRIARDLHDEVGSTLSSISILSQSALNGLQQDLDTFRFGNIGDKARAALDSMSDIVWSVNPENDSMEKLLARMSTYASEMLENVGAELHFQVGAGVESLTLPMEKRKDFYLVFKEAVHNCAKYAQAQNVEITLEKQDNVLIMSIKDDGIGFETKSNLAETRNLGGNGLRNMWSRAAAMGGTLALVSAPEMGTEVRLALPL